MPIWCSVVVPIYNDGHLAQDFCSEVERALLPHVPAGQTLEIIFVNDGSSDDSQHHLELTTLHRSWVTVVQLSRNFGQHAAVTCGYQHARGEYVAMVNVDLQDPPSEIPVMINLMSGGGYDIALGLRQNRQDPVLTKLGSLAFNTVLNVLTGSRVPVNSASLRVMNRRFLDAFLRLSERNPYLPGLENWLGFRRVYHDVPHRPRRHGRSSYTFRGRVRMAYHCILSFSDFPLKLMTGTGLMATMAGLLWGAWAAWVRLTVPGAQTGFASLLAAVVAFGGLNLTALGVASLYIGRILLEVQRRPQYVVRSITDSASGETERMQQHEHCAIP